MNAPVPALAVPLPSMSVPVHSTSTCRANVAIVCSTCEERQSYVVSGFSRIDDEDVSIAYPRTADAGRQPRARRPAARHGGARRRQPARVGLQARRQGGAAARSPHHAARRGQYVQGHARHRPDDRPDRARADSRRHVGVRRARRFARAGQGRGDRAGCAASGSTSSAAPPCRRSWRGAARRRARGIAATSRCTRSGATAPRRSSRSSTPAWRADTSAPASPIIRTGCRSPAACRWRRWRSSMRRSTR